VAYIWANQWFNAGAQTQAFRGPNVGQSDGHIGCIMENSFM